MPYNFVADSFNTKKLLSDFLRAKCHFRRKTAGVAPHAHIASKPPLGLRGATYDNHHRLTGQRAVDFLLVLIELFFARCYG